MVVGHVSNVPGTRKSRPTWSFRCPQREKSPTETMAPLLRPGTRLPEGNDRSLRFESNQRRPFSVRDFHPRRAVLPSGAGDRDDRSDSAGVMGLSAPAAAQPRGRSSVTHYRKRALGTPGTPGSPNLGGGAAGGYAVQRL